MNAYVTEKLGLETRSFFEVAAILFERFSLSAVYSERDLAGVVDQPTLRKVLTVLSASRAERLDFHKNKLEVSSPSAKPYELNSLLRYPIIRREAKLYCPYPQLIGYAATRGLFFRWSEEDRGSFLEPFRQSNESYVKEVLCSALPNAEILTEEDERKLGWKGKANDVTAIIGDSALLIECKTSGLYVDAKKTASPNSIISDVRKIIADAKERRGLFQLYDKSQAIRSKSLPTKLMEKYKNVERIYPVLLLFDEIQMANKAEVMGNIIKTELTDNGIGGFDYQIWHLEELDRLAEIAKSDLIHWTDEKFAAANKEIDLNSFLAEKSGKNFLRLILFIPEGETRAIRVLRDLVNKHAN